MKRFSEKPFLDWLKTLPCAVCHRNDGVDACHVRYADNRFNKPITGMGRKPKWWAVPMCRKHHDDQHRMGDERGFWVGQMRDPLELSLLLLHAFVTDDLDAAYAIILNERGSRL